MYVFSVFLMRFVIVIGFMFLGIGVIYFVCFLVFLNLMLFINELLFIWLIFILIIIVLGLIYFLGMKLGFFIVIIRRLV